MSFRQRPIRPHACLLATAPTLVSSSALALQRPPITWNRVGAYGQFEFAGSAKLLAAQAGYTFPQGLYLGARYYEPLRLGGCAGDQCFSDSGWGALAMAGWDIPIGYAILRPQLGAGPQRIGLNHFSSPRGPKRRSELPTTLGVRGGVELIGLFASRYSFVALGPSFVWDTHDPGWSPRFQFAFGFGLQI